ncbi:MAG: hypothetical protein GY790_11295 [Bacteroidetes bacterium]|nr:hypothetical protein [Bacteroidota bacterium]
MVKITDSISGLRNGGTPYREGSCILVIRNRSGSRLSLVIHSSEVNMVRAMSIRRYKRLKLMKGTYLLEAWLSRGRIAVDAHNIPHISIEKITSRKDMSFRGRKIVADLVNDHARLEINSEPTAGDLVQDI